MLRKLTVITLLFTALGFASQLWAKAPQLVETQDEAREAAPPNDNTMDLPDSDATPVDSGAAARTVDPGASVEGLGDAVDYYGGTHCYMKRVFTPDGHVRWVRVCQSGIY